MHQPCDERATASNTSGHACDGIPEKRTRIERMADVLREAYFEWLEKQPRKT